MGWRDWLGWTAKQETDRPDKGRTLTAWGDPYLRDYVTTSLTPARLVSLLKSFDGGDLADGFELAELMEESDAHLHSVATKRRMAVTRLAWQIQSASEVTGTEDARADEAADYCRQTLGAIDALDEALAHLALAIGRNISVCELVWGGTSAGPVLESIEPVEHGRLRFDLTGAQPTLRIRTAQDTVNGVPLTPNKWIVHAPHSASSLPFRGKLLTVTARLFVAKSYSFKDWLVFTEVFGMPVRVAFYDPATANADTKSEMLRMLQTLGTDAAGIFPRGTELEFKETGKQGETPYQSLADWCDRQMSKAWLGETLSTDTSGATGTYSAASVHKEVSEELAISDLREEANTLRRFLLAPLVRLKFGPDCPVPYWKRTVEEPKDPEQVARVLDAAANRLGMPVPRTWAYETLGIPEPAEGDEVLEGAPRAPGLFDGLGGGGDPNADPDDDPRANKLSLKDTATQDLAAQRRWQDAMRAATDAAYRRMLDGLLSRMDAAIATEGEQADVLAVLEDWMRDSGNARPLADLIGDLTMLSLMQGRLAVYSRLEGRRGR
jgi:phage gp29-like protein